MANGLHALGKEGHAGFVQYGQCPAFVVITGDPAKPSPFAGAHTLGAFTHGQPGEGTCAEADANDTAVILCTSGATGRPKGAEKRFATPIFEGYGLSETSPVATT